jgi:hypothetical protein
MLSLTTWLAKVNLETNRSSRGKKGPEYDVAMRSGILKCQMENEHPYTGNSEDEEDGSSGNSGLVFIIK